MAFQRQQFNQQFQNGSNFSYQRNNTGNQNYSRQQTQQTQQTQLTMSFEDQIDQRLDLFNLILQKAQEKGIDKDTLLIAQGLSAWVTSMLISK